MIHGREILLHLCIMWVQNHSCVGIYIFFPSRFGKFSAKISLNKLFHVSRCYFKFFFYSMSY